MSCGANQTAVSSRRRTSITFVFDSAEYGGAEAYVIHLLRHLPEEFEPAIVATRPVPDRIESATAELGIPLVTVEAVRRKFEVARLLRQARAVLTTGPDLVHVNLPTVAHSRHVLGALGAIRTPVIATLHLVAPLESAFQTRILRAAYQRLTRTIAVSAETKRQLCDDLHVDERTVRVIANGVEAQDIPKPARGAVRPVRIGALGRLTRQKGFDLLIEAVKRMAAEGQDVTAVIGGEGIERPALERMATRAPVELPGMVDDVPAFLAGLDLFCLPSRWEGLPFALLEAMMARLPCVAADVGDVAVALGSAGIVVPPEDVDALVGALRRLVGRRDERMRLGQAARARAKEHFSVEAMVEATVAVYREALVR